MRVVYVPINEKFWFDFYHQQAIQTGHGLPGYQGMPYQRGNGLGSFFGRLFRAILPVAKKVGKSALKTVGKEAIRMGSNVIGDIGDGVNIKTSLRKRGAAAGQNLLNKADQAISRNQSGKGLGKRKVASKVTSVARKKPRLQNKKKTQKRKRQNNDIFKNYGKNN